MWIGPHSAIVQRHSLIHCLMKALVTGEDTESQQEYANDVIMPSDPSDGHSSTN